jgi:hypothetical protein
MTAELGERSYSAIKRQVLRFLSVHPVDRVRLERGITELLELLDDKGLFDAFAGRLQREEGVVLSRVRAGSERQFDVRFVDEVVEAVVKG